MSTYLFLYLFTYFQCAIVFGQLVVQKCKRFFWLANLPYGLEKKVFSPVVAQMKLIHQMKRINYTIMIFSISTELYLLCQLLKELYKYPTMGRRHGSVVEC